MREKIEGNQLSKSGKSDWEEAQNFIFVQSEEQEATNQ